MPCLSVLNCAETTLIKPFNPRMQEAHMITDAVLDVYADEVERVKYQRDEAWERIETLEIGIWAVLAKLRAIEARVNVHGTDPDVTVIATMLADTVITRRSSIR